MRLPVTPSRTRMILPVPPSRTRVLRPVTPTVLETATRWSSPPLPDTLDELREGLQDIYTSNRRFQMSYLRFVWELGRWADVALAVGAAEGWPVAAMVRALREDPDVLFPWKYATLRAYRLLGRAEWRDIAKCGSVDRARAWVREQNRTPSEARALKERKARSRRRDTLYSDRMRRMEIENDGLSKVNRELVERLRILEAAADPSAIEDLEAVVRDHAEAERLAHTMVKAAEAKADLWEGRVQRVEREAAHLRIQVAKLRADPFLVVNDRVHRDRPANGGGDGNGGGASGLWDRPPGAAA